MAVNHSSARRLMRRRQRRQRQNRRQQQQQQQQHLNNGNDDVYVNVRQQQQPNNVVRRRILDIVNRWREVPSDSNERRLRVSWEINQLEAIFIVGNLRRDLLLEASSGNNPQTTTLQLSGEESDGEGFSDEVIDFFCDFLQETPCHLLSLRLKSLPHQLLRRLLQALHHNTSIKELEITGLQDNDGGLIEELLRHKRDLRNLRLHGCHFTSHALTDPLSGMTHLTILGLESCRLGDEGVQAILQQRTHPSITALDLSFNQITSNGLGILARRIPEALPSLEILNLGYNPDLLNSPENARLFVDNVLPMLKELRIADCGKDSGYIQIIKACCEAEITIGNKLELLGISTMIPHQAIRNQLVESLPKLKVKRLDCNCLPVCGLLLLFPPPRSSNDDDHALLVSALYKNTSIVELDSINDESRRHVAPILQRNKLLTNIERDFLGGGGTTAAAIMPTLANDNDDDDDANTSITTRRGRWSRVLAEVGRANHILGATPVYKILQAGLAPWLLQQTQLLQRERAQQQQKQQQQDDEESIPIEPDVAQSDIAHAATVRASSVMIEDDGLVGTITTLDDGGLVTSSSCFQNNIKKAANAQNKDRTRYRDRYHCFSLWRWQW